MSSTTFTAHYISGTHWDREWYRPFQEYRVLLVRLMDGLLDLMQTSEDFRYVQLDGQTCVLTDYLDIRPHRKAELAKLIEQGRILIGPWFTMPDLFCVGDEALIRNLLLGRRICKQWNVDPMPVGFICDMFGHPSQTAQIFQGFDITDCVLGRGTNESTTPAYFRWQSPDGSELFTFKLQDENGYGAFAIPRATMEASPEKPLFVQESMKEFMAELTAAGNDADQQRQVREKYFRITLSQYVGHEQSRANGPVLCLMDSMDHIPPATDVVNYLRLIREANPGVEPQHSTLPRFFADARKLATNLPVRRGELREPARNRNGYLWLIPDCVSARVRMKQANDTCQTLLEKWVEPLLALADPRGRRIPSRFLEVAWEHVLANHAHDTICGCSIDQVHRDMMYRFDQARVLGRQLRHQALAILTEDCAELATEPDALTVVAFNPMPAERDEVVTFDIDFPLNYPTEFQEGFGTQLVKSFTLHDVEGNELPYQRLAYEPKTNERTQLAQFCFISDGPFTRYTVAAKLKMPAMGFTAVQVKPSKMPVRAWGSLRTGPASAANEHLAIAIEPAGALSLTDKATGQTYANLLTFEDRSELGDGWFHGHSLNDEQILSSASAAQVSVVHDGPEMVSFRSTVTLRVPARYDYGLEKPLEQTVPLTISSVISLRRGAKVVEVKTTVENTAEDHRLRLLLPTDATKATTWLAHHPYDLVERPIALDATTSRGQEADHAEKPFLGLQAVGDGTRGLTLISAGGLHQGGVADDQRRTMHITLLRSFRRTVGTGGEPDGLEKTTLEYRYALMPYRGDFPAQTALSELAKLQAGVLTRQTGARSSGYAPLSGRRKPHRGFMRLEHGRLVMSAFKPAEDGSGTWIIRLWNPTGDTLRDTLTFERPVQSARMLKLSEMPDDAAKAATVRGASVEVEAGPHRMVTLGIALA
ncbi:MAG: hypothetical protein IT440_05385 [Phycisphaeraceae bacterium]|nr:hypothetical protein [Phycisphaeraceae bacterium]